MECKADPGQTCDSLRFQFTDNVQFSSGADFAGQPYSIGLTGSGPDATFSLSTAVGNKQLFPPILNNTAPAGNYSFSSSGLITIPVSNLTTAATFRISGGFAVASGNAGDKIVLPDSFNLTLGQVTPEPATWSLAGDACCSESELLRCAAA